MTTTRILLALLLGALTGSAVPGQPVVKNPKDLKWNERPGGVYVAVLHGDPERPGPFVLRLKYPAGYHKAPHYHPADAFVTVLAGKYFRGYGPVERPSEAVELVPGTFSVNPAGVSHYEWTEEPAELQVQATGPWESVYVDEEGNPLTASEKGMPK